MPSSTSGFTGDEIITYVKGFIGNQSSEFQTFLTSLLPLAEFRYCKMHDWNFLQKRNLSLTVASGTEEYTLNTAAIGFEMPAAQVKSVYCPASGIYLKKVGLDEIRRMDPDQNDGNSAAHLTHWAESGDNKIVVYPPTFADTTLKIDGEITPSALLTTSNYPTIPFRYQDAFIQTVLATALGKENDDRANAFKQEAIALMRADIATDLAQRASGGDPRIKSQAEQRLDGVSGNTDPLNMLFDPSGY